MSIYDIKLQWDPKTRWDKRKPNPMDAVWRTIDSWRAKFCDNCGEKDQSLLTESSSSGFTVWHCQACLEAKRLDDEERAGLLGQGPPTAEEWEAMKRRVHILDLDKLLIDVRLP